MTRPPRVWSRRAWLLSVVSAAGGAWAQDWGGVIEWLNEDAPEWLTDMARDAAQEQILYHLREHAPELLRMAEEG
ncbi:MAG: hypothetical protein KBA51_05300, partial [Kiritimatiellae bacterium]|nr:hypothetical protein [Kiritimatiellia bacterium]